MVVFLAPGQEFTAHVEPGAVRLLQFDDAECILRRLPPGRAGKVRSWAFQCVASRPTCDDFAELFATLSDLVGGKEPAPSGPAPKLSGELENRLAAWLTGFLVDVGGLTITLPAALSLAADSRCWLEQREMEDVALAQVAQAFGVSARWLQRCFSERWGQTPMDFIVIRRLARARARLAESDGTTVIGEVARECGFRNSGRFAVLYRTVYGESPSQTVASARYRRHPTAE
jgi:AraC-like DNA-binding protein